jgi:hypothetical protein
MAPAVDGRTVHGRGLEIRAITATAPGTERPLRCRS